MSDTLRDGINPLEFPGWDDLIYQHPAATVFHGTAWARVLIDTYGFTPCYLVHERDGRLAGVLPLMEVRGLFGQRRGVSLPFTDACPPLLTTALPISSPALSQSAASTAPAPLQGWHPPAAPPILAVPKEDHDGASHTPPATAEDGATAPTASGPASCPGTRSGTLTTVAASHPLLAAALDLARRRQWKSLELREANAWTIGLPRSVEFHGHVLDLTGGEEAVFGRFESSVRRALRKAEKSELEIVHGRDEAQMREYYRLHGLTRRRQGAPPQPYSFFEAIRRHLLMAGHGFVVLARTGGQAVAGAVYLHGGANALYKFGASDEKYQALRPNNRVFLEAIRLCLAKGCTSLDFGRTSLGNAGLRRFKLGWGAVERLVPYTRHHLASGTIEPTPDHTEGWQTAVFRALPVPVARILGRVAYRFAA